MLQSNDSLVEHAVHHGRDCTSNETPARHSDSVFAVTYDYVIKVEIKCDYCKTAKYTSVRTCSHHAGAQKRHIIHTNDLNPDTQIHKSSAKPHIHTGALSYHEPHSYTHTRTHAHTAAVHTSPPLVQTQTPHASAPHSISHRPQEKKKKQMGTSCLDESPVYAATVLLMHVHTARSHSRTHMHTHSKTQHRSAHKSKSSFISLTASNNSVDSSSSIYM